MACVHQDIPKTAIPVDVSRISLVLTLLTCMTSQSILPPPPSPLHSSPSSSSSSPSPKPISISSCPQQCNNRGDCLRGSNDVIYCKCNKGWIGNACSQSCDKRCVYGKCQMAGHAQVCICSFGYHGDRCQHKNPDVASFLRMAKMLSRVVWSKLLPQVQDPTQKLEKMIQNGSSDCSSSFRCQNGGKCKHGLLGGYRCQCASSKYTGDFCQFACPHPCVNGGKCIRYRSMSTSSPASNATSHTQTHSLSLSVSDGSDLQYACACPKEYTGRFCQRKRGRDSTAYVK